MSRLSILLFLAVANAQFVATETEGCPKIVSRDEWDAKRPYRIEYAVTPIRYVVVDHTAGETCTTNAECVRTMQSLQDDYQLRRRHNDVPYNFVVAGDGRAYEAVGWHKVGSHTNGFNNRSVGIAFVGNFARKLPSQGQLRAAKDLLDCGLRLGELDADYRLIPAAFLRNTLSPGAVLIDELRSWRNYAETA